MTRRGMAAAAAACALLPAGSGGCGGGGAARDAQPAAVASAGPPPISSHPPAAREPGAGKEQTDEEYIREILAQRANKDRFFRTEPKSPVPDAERRALARLAYFPVDPAWRLRLPLLPAARPETVTMITSTGEERRYSKLGTVEIEHDGARGRLGLYRPMETAAGEDSVWVPFIDAAAGRETYPAGRYVDAEMLPDGTVLIDFNLAYNPYCAYGWEGYSCPLTPRENRLPFAVPAGERGFRAQGRKS